MTRFMASAIACLCLPVHRVWRLASASALSASALCVESGGASVEDALDWAGEVEAVDVSDAVEAAFPSSSRVGLSADRALSNSIRERRPNSPTKVRCVRQDDVTSSAWSRPFRLCTALLDRRPTIASFAI